MVDAVTVAEVAAAADVSEKTVFNHFATKEDLAFAGREERLNGLLADIVQRPPGSSVLDVFRATTNAMIDDLVAGGDDDFLALPKIISGSRALQERLTMGWEDESAALTAVIAETSGAAHDDVVPAIVARTLSWTHRTMFGVALTGVLTGEDREQLAARLRLAADRAYDQFAGGLGDYGKGADVLDSFPRTTNPPVAANLLGVVVVSRSLSSPGAPRRARQGAVPGWRCRA